MSTPPSFGSIKSPDRKKRVRAAETPDDLPPSEVELPQKRPVVESLSVGAAPPAMDLHSPLPSFEKCDSNSSNFRNVPEAQVSDVISGFFQTGSSDFLKSGFINTLSLKIAKLQRDVSRLETTLADKDAELLSKDTRIVSLQQEVCSLQEERSQLRVQLQSIQSLTNRMRAALVTSLRGLEDKKRKELKVKLSRDATRLGRLTVLRGSALLQDLWEDGSEVVEVKEQLAQVTREREALEKVKKQTKPRNEELVALQLKIALMQREESDLKSKLEKIDLEKTLYLEENRRMIEEDSSAYSRASPSHHEPWPILQSRYLLLSLLGKGGFSEVYRGFDLDECREIAVKFHQLNHSWPEDVKRSYIKHALRENLIHKELDHPRIVKHYNTLEVDGSCFCTLLEYCQGEDLHKYLQRYKMLSEKEAKLIVFQLFQGLKYLSEQPEKVIHYDLKPHNILLHNGEVKITDFGLSKRMGQSQTPIELTSQGVGTYWYQPPECFEMGSPTISSKVDVWSAGVIFYEMLYGQKPFGNSMTQEKIFREQVITNAKHVYFPPKPVISTECKEFIRRCLRYDQAERWDVEEAYMSPYLQGKSK